MTDEDPKSFEEVLRRGKGLLSDIDNKRELALRNEQEELNREQKRRKEEEENRLSRIRLSQENFRLISGTSVIPFYSAINRELLGDRGKIFDWVRQDTETHWHWDFTDHEYMQGVEKFIDTTTDCSAHKVTNLLSGITLPNKGQVFTFISVEEQFGKHHSDVLYETENKMVPYRVKKRLSILGRNSYTKVYLQPEWESNNKLLNVERAMHVCYLRNSNITSIIPQISSCKRSTDAYDDSDMYVFIDDSDLYVSLGEDKETMHIHWSEAVVKQIEKIY